MANHKSAIKRIRQNEKRYERNRKVKSAVRTSLKKVRAAISSGSGAENTEELARSAESQMAKAVTKGVFHKKTAQRSISRMRKALNSATQA